MAEMKRIKISLDNEMFSSDNATDIVALLSISYDENYFPNSKWTDFVCSVLGMWAHTLQVNETLSNVNFSLYFMDGPYRLDAFKDENMWLILKCINSRSTDIVEYTFQCEYYEMVEALREAFKKITYILHSRRMHDGKHRLTYEQSLITAQKLKQILDRSNKRSNP